jgi:acetolactate synthase I/III small subunit
MKNPTKHIRELAIVKVVAGGSRQDEALNVVGAWSGRLLELSSTHFTAELTGEPEKLSFFIEALSDLGSVSSIRSGPLGLAD